ncbi:MAG: hypothetical protein D3906_14850 [Candidatus Electrothrix sp. AUS1_2]|nr:hypothetical protein [Candidatus Electrothrix sp. AUS1_2]
MLELDIFFQRRSRRYNKAEIRIGYTTTFWYLKGKTEINRKLSQDRGQLMKNNTLQKPLVYSALVLILFSTLVYLIAGSHEATTFGALQSSFTLVVLGILRTIQWLVAMLIALTACLAFLFALFLGAVSIFDRETAAQMYGSLKNNLLDAVLPCTGQCCPCSSVH